MDIRERIKNVMIAALNEAKITAADVLKNRAEGLAKIHGAKGTKRTEPSFDPEVVKKTPIKPVSKATDDRGHEGTRQDRGARNKPPKRTPEQVRSDLIRQHGSLRDRPPVDKSIGDH